MGAIGTNGRKALAPSTLNMLPKFELAPMRMYLRMLAKTLRPSSTPSSSTIRSLFQQDDVRRGFLGDVHRGVHRDAHVGGAQRGRVVDAVAHEADDVPLALERPDDALLVRRRQPGEHVGRSRRPRPVRRRSSSRPGCRAEYLRRSMPTSWQTLRVTRSLSPVRTFTATPCLLQRADGLARPCPSAGRGTRRSRVRIRSHSSSLEISRPRAEMSW